jgi:P pilus assembly chaperone PapD
MKKLSLTFLAMLILGNVYAQLSLAPTAIFLDKNGIGNLYVTNSSGTPQEISINFQFGYSDQDNNGVLIMVYNDSINAPNHAIDKYLKAFPRTFILPPNQQQIVRLQARLPKDMKPGTYFTRVKVASSGQVTDIGNSGTDVNGITTKVNVRFEQVIACFYKNANVTTGLTIEKIETNVDSNLIAVDSYYKTTGNSPFLGRVQLVLKDPDGNKIGEANQTVALYFSGRRRIVLNLPEDHKKGTYTVEYTYTTDRSDIAKEDLIQAPSVVSKAQILIK